MVKLKVKVTGNADVIINRAKKIGKLEDNQEETIMEFLELAKTAMRKKIAPWSYRKAKGVGVYNSFVIRKATSKNGFLASLENIAPHANMLESGVDPHIVSLSLHPEVRRWGEKKGLQLKGTNKLLIGGPNSSIQKGKSDRQFFYNTLDQLLAQGVLDKKIQKSLKKATK